MSRSAHDSNGFNPFLDPAEHTQASHNPPEPYQHPFSDATPAEHAETYINPFTDAEPQEHATAAAPYVNPFHDAESSMHQPAETSHSDPFLESHTRTIASAPADTYVNPFEASPSALSQSPARTGTVTRSKHAAQAAAAFNTFEDPPSPITDAISKPVHLNQPQLAVTTHTQSALDVPNPFGDPSSPVPAPPASTERLQSPQVQVSAADASSPCNEGASVLPVTPANTHLLQPASVQSDGPGQTHSRHAPHALLTEPSELPPFTVADLRETTSEIPAVTGTESQHDSFDAFTEVPREAAHADSSSGCAHPSTFPTATDGLASVRLSGNVEEEQHVSAGFADLGEAATAEGSGRDTCASYIPQTDTASHSTAGFTHVHAPADMSQQGSAEFADFHSMPSAAETGSPTSSSLHAHSLHHSSNPAGPRDTAGAVSDAVQEHSSSQGAVSAEGGPVITASTDLNEALPSQGELDQHTAAAAAQLGQGEGQPDCTPADTADSHLGVPSSEASHASSQEHAAVEDFDDVDGADEGFADFAAAPADMPASSSDALASQDPGASPGAEVNSPGAGASPGPADTAQGIPATEAFEALDQTSSGSLAELAGAPSQVMGSVVAEEPQSVEEAQSVGAAKYKPEGAAASTAAKNAVSINAGDDDWGSEGDEFGDFNNAAAEQGHDEEDYDGFGAFTDADAHQPAASAVPTEPSNASQHQRAAVKAPAAASSLAQLLDAEPSQVPGIIQKLLQPFAAPFTITPRQASPSSKANGSKAWRYDGEALMKYHLGLIQGLPQGQILPRAGLLGQPAPGSTCPTAPSLLHSKVRGGLWQGSRGDKRLLARLGLSQAGEQDEKDAQARAASAKNRWRQRPADAGTSTQPSTQPAPKKGPLSYLSTVTTMPSSDWGSQSLQRITPQPSLLARQPSGLTSPEATAAPARQGSFGQQPSGTPRAPAKQSSFGQQPSGASSAPAKQGSFAQEPSSTAGSSQQVQAAAPAHPNPSVRHLDSLPAVTQDTRSLPAPHSSSGPAPDLPSSSQAVPSDGSTIAQSRQAGQASPEAASSGQSAARQGKSALPIQAHAASDQSNWAPQGADWGAFDGLPNSLSATAPPSGQVTDSMSSANTHDTGPGWDVFGQPPLGQGSAPMPQAEPSSHTPSRMLQHPLASSGAPGTSTSLQATHVQPKAQPDARFGAQIDADPWQASEQIPGQPTAAAAREGGGATAVVDRMGSGDSFGDSFGDFDAAGEQAGFEASEWHTAPALAPDPFAASASFKDFTALRQEAESAADVSPSMLTHTEQPSANGDASTGLTELQAGVYSTDASPAQTGAAVSGLKAPKTIVVAGISIPDLSFMLTQT